MRLLIDDDTLRQDAFARAYGGMGVRRMVRNSVAELFDTEIWLQGQPKHITHIYLDGDLGCEPFSGEDIARMMAGLNLHTNAKVYIHSANVLRSRAMFDILKATHDVKEVCWDDVVNTDAGAPLNPPEAKP